MNRGIELLTTRRKRRFSYLLSDTRRAKLQNLVRGPCGGRPRETPGDPRKPPGDPQEASRRPRPQEAPKMAPRPPQEVRKGTKIEAKRLPRSKKESIRTENIEISKMTTLSMKMLDFDGSGGSKISKFRVQNWFGGKKNRG